jgi:hypothetical protein
MRKNIILQTIDKNEKSIKIRVFCFNYRNDELITRRGLLVQIST